jgi:hypothetical protein
MTQDIKVICEDRMCFKVDPVTLDPRSCGYYDAYAFSDPEDVPSMSHAEWCLKRSQQRAKT